METVIIKIHGCRDDFCKVFINRQNKIPKISVLHKTSIGKLMYMVDEDDVQLLLKQDQTHIFSESSTIDICNNTLSVYQHPFKNCTKLKIKELDYVEGMQNVFDNFLKHRSKLEQELIEVKDEFQAKEKDSAERKRALYSFLNESNEKYKITMSGFIQLLKEKDRRIQFLTDIIEGDVVKLDTKRPVRKTRKPKCEELSSSGEDTDQEPCVKSQKLADSLEDDLFADDVEKPTLSLPGRAARDEKAALGPNFIKSNEPIVENMEVDSQIDCTPFVNYSTQNLIDDL